MAVLNWWSDLSGSSRLCACSEEEREREREKQKEKEKKKEERRKRKTDYSYSRALLGNYFQLQLQACLRRRIIALHYSRIRNVIIIARMVLCEKAYQITNAKTYVFSNSVLCVGKWEMTLLRPDRAKIKWYSENNHFKGVNRIDGMPTEFEWKVFQGITTLGSLLDKIQSLMRRTV